MKKIVPIILIFSCCALTVSAQSTAGLKSIISSMDTARSRLPIEKLYLQTDKPNYVLGDTLHFKSYLLNADYLTPSAKSGLLYVELDNINNQMIKRIMVQVTSGISRGDLVLNDGDVPEGSYTLRAYTNWMRNFGEDYVFKKNIYISAFSNPILLKSGFKADSQPSKSKNSAATLARINRPENMDVQFMPEGGNLVAGIATKVGFKVIGEDGRGADVSGKIVNSKNQTISNIQTLHKGMGSFELTSQLSETYTAVINLPNKTTKSYALPKVSPVGTALRIISKGDDSLQVMLSNTTINNTNYYLIAQSRGVVCYAAAIKFTAQTINKTLSKALFPTGIVRFSLLNQNNIPLNERIAYIDHHDNLNITFNTNKPNYVSRDSVALNIDVKDKDNNPVHGTFSLAVTDDGQVRPDTAGSNIVNDLLFTSDLKGNIEEPGWYFEDSPNDKTIALDNLLLTQGWMGYDWKHVFGPTTEPQYKNEKEFIVQGKVTNVFNKAIEGSQVLLMGKTTGVFRDTMTDKNGVFTFKKLFPIDTAEFKLQATNKNGKAFNVGIAILNEFTPPVFTATLEQPLSGYISSDTTLLNDDSVKVAQLQAEADYMGGGHLLKTVEIKDKKIIPGSHNRNGPGEADETITENEIKQIRSNRTLFNLLALKFKSFRGTSVLKGSIAIGGAAGAPTVHSYTKSSQFELYGHGVVLFVDGISTTYEMASKLRAEDIKGIEVMRTAKYALAYDPDFTNKSFLKSGRHLITFTGEDDIPIFLEITTYSGQGAYFNRTQGTYVYRPLPFTLPMAFYRPRYTVKNINTAPGSDLRSTIHWEPNVITDKNGKATVSFFSADKPADYTVIMEGTDLNGNLGYQRKSIKVISPTTASK